MPWYLRWYEKTGDRLLGEERLDHLRVESLRAQWNRPADDPMYLAYPVTHDQVSFLEGIVGHPLAVDDLDYFVEYLE